MKKGIAATLTALAGFIVPATFFTPFPASADDAYPDRPIMLMVSYGAGGATDLQARTATLVASGEDMLGQPIAVVNKPGAGGRAGWNWFATRAKADGYTLATYNLPHFIAQSVKGGVKYSEDSFEPIANWGADPAVFIVSEDSPFGSMAEALEFAKANPGKLTFSGAGRFVGHHIAALQLEKATGAKLAYIPAKGGGVAAMKAVIAGNVMAGINNLSDAFRAREAGNVRILGVFDLERSALLPDVPTMKEQGLDIDNASVNFRGIMAPKGTPQAIIDKLAVKIPEMFAHAAVVRQMKASGSPMRIMTRDEVGDMWEARRKTLEELLKGL